MVEGTRHLTFVSARWRSRLRWISILTYMRCVNISHGSTGKGESGPNFGSKCFQGAHLNRLVVGMAVGPATGGYWLVATDGGIFAFGSAPFYGSSGIIKLNRPMIGGADDDATGGYWLIASDGGVFTYYAPFLGSAA
jgi:hypothetical protein